MATLIGQFTNAAGAASVGYVRLEPARSADGTYLRDSVLNVGDGNIVGPDRVEIDLDEGGGFIQEVEPGDYQVAIILRNSRIIHAVITVPNTNGDVPLSSLL